MKRYKLIKQTRHKDWKESDDTSMEIGRVVTEDEIINDKPMSYWIEGQEEYWKEVTDEEQGKDNINPDHYKQGKVECIDAIESATVNKKGIEAVCTGNIIRYIWRYESKNGIEDVKKANWYLQKLINHLNDKENG